MKFNFKKIAATFAATALFGVTIVAPLGAAQSPSSVFTQGDTAIIYGAASVQSDLAAATNIQTALGLTATTSGSAGVGSDSVQLARGSDEFNLGDDMLDFYTTLGGDSDELPSVLADGVYFNDENDDFEYEQEITLTDATSLVHFADRDYNDEEPSIGFHFTTGEAIMNYTLEFTDSAEGEADFVELESTTIEILGREYFISEVGTEGDTITLLDAATTTIVKPGESTTVNVGGTSYEVSVSAISDEGAILVVNGQSTNRLGAGDTQKLPGGTTHLGVVDFQKAEYASDPNAFVEFNLGSGEIVLTDGEEVEINGEDVSDIEGYEGYVLNAYVNNDTATTIDLITLEWLADDDVFLTADTELTMPGFEAIKFTMGELMSEGTEEMVTFNAGDPISVTAMVEDGEAIIDLFYVNGSDDDAFGTNLGESDGRWLITINGTDPSLSFDVSDREEYFVASWLSGRDAETYVFEVTVDEDGEDNVTTLTSLSGGSNVEITNTESEDVGRLRFTVDAVDPRSSAETVTISISPVSGGTTYADRVFTTGGLRFLLPVEVDDNATTLADGNGVFFGPNFGADTTWSMNLTEEDLDGNIAEGSSFQVEVSIDADDGIEADGATLPAGEMLETPDTDDWVGYVQSDLATRIDWTKDTSGLDSMEITYPGEESFAEIFVSSTDTSSGPTTTPVIIRDSEASGNERNWIVVGGSAVNTVAAQLLGVSYPAHGTAFTAASGVNSGEWLIRTFTHPNAPEKVATLVAGYNAGETTNAASYFTARDPTIAAGTQYIGTSADSATESVAESS